MNRLKKIMLFFLIIAPLITAYGSGNSVISLHGKWKVFLDKENRFGNHYPDTSFTDVIILPGTLDQARLGNKSGDSDATNHLMRKYSYYGRAWYQCQINIPAKWQHSTIELYLERTRPSHVFIDGKACGNSLTISAPQTYNLSKELTPGRHTLTVMVDNGTNCGLPPEIGSSHMWSDDTQTNWNGILGRIELISNEKISINNFRTRSDIARNSANIDLEIANLYQSEKHVLLQVFNKGNEGVKKLWVQKLKLKPGLNKIQFACKLGENVATWDEYSPTLHQLHLELRDKQQLLDSTTSYFGLREMKTAGRSFTLNEKRIFLRGRHDACVFPLTGYAPMNNEAWEKYFETVKEYGFNHVRFHSWCPPEAAFTAADNVGIYLQPELPYWGLIENNPESPIVQFLIREGKAMLKAFGNHPSFVMFSTGNELWGEIAGMQHITNTLRAYDNRPLYTLGTNYHLGWQGEQTGEDYMVSCRVGGNNDTLFEPHVRGSFSFADAIDGGILNAKYPNTRMNFSTGVRNTSKPVISHETGQYQMYPDRTDLKNYTGVLQPRNLEIFVQRIENKYGKENYEKYFNATAALSLCCYKADLEMMRRTPELAGFQMLDLQDFPGQGTAIVGIVNATMQPKGIISSSEFRSWNNDIVPLWISGSYTFEGGQASETAVQISNNSLHDIENKTLIWELKTNKNQIIRSGEIKIDAQAGRLSNPVTLMLNIPDNTPPIACKLELSIANTEYHNKYPVWIYPGCSVEEKLFSNVKVFTTCDVSLENHLASGGKALLMPDKDGFPLQTIGGLFTSDYWNFSMFKTISENAKKPVSPGTMGLLIDDKHPIFRDFPTESHSNWQWWPVVKESNPIVLDGFENKIHPIVISIDNIERMSYLATIFETNIGKGKLLVCMSDLKNSLQFKENAQLYKAIIKHLNSEEFQPKDTITPEELRLIFSREIDKKAIHGVKNVSYD